MRVLYLGPFRDNSGWSVNAQNQILALDAAGVEVVARCVKFTDREPGPIPERLLELERRDARGCDVVIQNVLPTVMERAGDAARQIAYYFAEANRLPRGWADRVSLLDESWVPSLSASDAEYRSGVGRGRRIEVVPCAADVTRYQRSYKPHQIREEFPDHFFFYTIGEGRRKNLPDLIRAFHRAFTPDEPVDLIIKTSLPGVPAPQAKALIERDIAAIKGDLNLYRNPAAYRKEIVMTDRLSDHDLMRLHATGDCFVSASHGEGWNLGCFDAMAMGKTPIYTKVGGHMAFLNEERGFPIGGRMEPIHGLHDGFYTGRQDWFKVDVLELATRMREVYEARGTLKPMAKAGMKHAHKFSFKQVGNLMREILEEQGG